MVHVSALLSFLNLVRPSNRLLTHAFLTKKLNKCPSLVVSAWKRVHVVSNCNYRVFHRNCFPLRKHPFSDREESSLYEKEFENEANSQISGFGFGELESCASADTRLKHFTSLMHDTFYLTEDEVNRILENNPVLWNHYLQKSFSHLKHLGLEKSTFIRHPWLCCLPTDQIDTKLCSIEKIFPDLLNINKSAVLFSSHFKNLEKLLLCWKKETLSGKFQYPSKFHFLSHILKVPISEILDQIESKRFLITLPYFKVFENVTIFLDAGVSETDIFNDLWVIRHRPNSIRNRIEALQQISSPLKTWLFRTKTYSFDKYIEEFLKSKYILKEIGNLSAMEYLALRLNCDASVVSQMIKKHPKLSQINLYKLKMMLDYLLIEKRVDPEHVTKLPRLLCSKLDTIKIRKELLDSMNLDYASLWPLAIPQHKFNELVERNRSNSI